MFDSVVHSMRRAVGILLVMAALLAAVALVSGCTVYESRQPPWAYSGGWHRVAPGDQLGRLACAYGVSLAAFAQANDIPPPYTIYVDQELRIPVQAERASEAEPPKLAKPPAVVQSATVGGNGIAEPSPAATRWPAWLRRSPSHPDP